MANTSATGGYLTPAASPAPLEDKALFDFFQEWFVGLTGISASLVRPRWQPYDVPNIPDETIDWIAFGITKTDPDTFAAELHFTAAPSYNELRSHEGLEILVSTYGPNSGALMSVLRNGMQVGQNRETLSLNNMGLIETGKPLPFPELVKTTWYRRTDTRIRIRRQIKYQYGILDLASAQGTLNNDIYVEPILVENNS